MTDGGHSKILFGVEQGAPPRVRGLATAAVAVQHDSTSEESTEYILYVLYLFLGPGDCDGPTYIVFVQIDADILADLVDFGEDNNRKKGSVGCGYGRSVREEGDEGSVGYFLL